MLLKLKFFRGYLPFFMHFHHSPMCTLKENRIISLEWRPLQVKFPAGTDFWILWSSVGNQENMNYNKFAWIKGLPGEKKKKFTLKVLGTRDENLTPSTPSTTPSQCLSDYGTYLTVKAKKRSVATLQIIQTKGCAVEGRSDLPVNGKTGKM